MMVFINIQSYDILASEVKMSVEPEEILQDDSNNFNIAYDKEQEKQRDKWNNFLANHVKISRTDCILVIYLII